MLIWFSVSFPACWDADFDDNLVLTHLIIPRHPIWSAYYIHPKHPPYRILQGFITEFKRNTTSQSGCTLPNQLPTVGNHQHHIFFSQPAVPWGCCISPLKCPSEFSIRGGCGRNFLNWSEKLVLSKSY